jgi:hypothetical protein
MRKTTGFLVNAGTVKLGVGLRYGWAGMNMFVPFIFGSKYPWYVET